MIAQCWLHIGIEKTGTTSIQEFLSRNREALLKRGFLHPVAPGRTNHIGLACYALEDQRLDSIRRSQGILTQVQLERYRSRLIEEIDMEIKSLPASSLIFSNEHLSSRLRTHAEIERIKRFCDRIATRTKIVVYLRNQVDFLVSRYIEAVKGGSSNTFSFQAESAISRQIDYTRMLAPWREIFGVENLVVRRFEQIDFEGGDLLLDFAALCGIDGRPLDPVPRHNVALDGQCVEFLREFNRHVPHIIQGRRNPLRGDLIRHLESASSGEPFSISAETAAAIEEHFDSSNRVVSEQYFGFRNAPLFSPARKTALTPVGQLESAESIRIAAHLWRAQQTRLNAIESHRGPKHEPSGSTGAAKGQGWKAVMLRYCTGVARWLKSKSQRSSARAGY